MSAEPGKIAAMVLAAGLGTRLRPLTDLTPKPLVPVAGRPMIHYPLLWLRGQGVREVYVNTFHLGHALEAALGDGSDLGLKIIYSREETLLGTGGGIARARRLFGRRRVAVVNADTIIDADLGALLAVHSGSGAVASLAVVETGDRGTYTPVLVDNSGRVRAIAGQPVRSGDAAGNLRSVTFAGLSILEPELIDFLPEDRPGSVVEQAWLPALAHGRELRTWLHRGYWKTLDDRDRIREAEDDFRHGRVSLARLFNARGPGSR